MTPSKIKRINNQIKKAQLLISMLETRISLLKRDYNFQDEQEQRRRDFVIADDEEKLQRLEYEVSRLQRSLNMNY